MVQASLDVGRAWAQVKPLLNLTASYTRNQDAPPVFGPPPDFVAPGGVIRLTTRRRNPYEL